MAMIGKRTFQMRPMVAGAGVQLGLARRLYHSSNPCDCAPRQLWLHFLLHPLLKLGRGLPAPARNNFPAMRRVNDQDVILVEADRVAEVETVEPGLVQRVVDVPGQECALSLDDLDPELFAPAP